MERIYKISKQLVTTKIRMQLKLLYMCGVLLRFTQPLKIWIKKHQFFIWLGVENKAVDDYIFIHCDLELDIGSIVEEHLSMGEVFVDIGTNMGYSSVLGHTN